MPRPVSRKPRGRQAPAGPRNQEPLAEGIVPITKGGRREWGAVPKLELVDLAKKFVQEKGIRTKEELRKVDHGLYGALYSRKLLDSIDFEDGQKNWASMGDDELIRLAMKVIEEKSIRNKGGLRKENCGLYVVLWRRKLLDRVGLRNKNANHRDWASISNEKLVEHTRDFMKEKKITGKTELRKANHSLYRVLGGRKLLDKVGFKRKHGHLASMSDDELVSHAKRFVKENGIRGKSELRKASNGLYEALRKRKLLDKVGFEERQKGWSSFSDTQLVERARRLMEERGIRSRTELQKAASGLYHELRERKLLTKVGFEDKSGRWSKMSDDELVVFARNFMKENGISGRTELKKADNGLYLVLGKRKLLDRVGFEEKHMNWASMSDDELVAFARNFMKENGIRRKVDLRNAYPGLYDVLERRTLMNEAGFEEKMRRKRLLDKVGFVEKRRRPRQWKDMSDEELVAFAKEFMEEKGISGRSELKRADSGLHEAMRQRKLLDKVGFVEKKRKPEKRREARSWKGMSDEELVAFAKEFMEKTRISGRKEFRKADSGLHEALRQRKLLEKVGFVDKRRLPGKRQGARPWKEMDDGQLVGFAKNFMKEEGINGRNELLKADRGLYDVLKKRELLDAAGLVKKCRDWESMNNDELVDYVKEFIKTNQITTREGFREADAGLHEVLRRRGLMNSIGLQNKNAHHRDWASMSDEELISYVQEFVKENGIKLRSEIAKFDDGLYTALKTRRLMNRIGIKSKTAHFKSWAHMSDEELVQYAKKLKEERGIKRSKEFEKANPSLYQTLQKRKLLGRMGFEKSKWASLSSSGLVQYANRFINRMKISSKKELHETYPGLYGALRRRKLLDKVELPEKPVRRMKQKPRKIGKWADITDEELVGRAKKLIKEKGIKNRKGLERENSSLYNVLLRRKLLDKIPFEQKKKETRKWFLLSDGELLECGKKFVEANEIKSRTGIQRAAQGLYNALLKRKLLDEIEFEEGQRSWTSMSDEELLNYAKKVVDENGIKSKSELENHDSGLHAVLGRRKLLDKIYFMRAQPTGRDWASMSDDEIVDYAKRFTKVNRISRGGELAKADPGLYDVLRRRKLLDRVEFKEKRRSWASMSDEELVKETKKLIEEKRIKTRSQLSKKLGGLYKALETRELLERVGFGPPKKFAKPRRFRDMSDDELVDFAKKVIEEKGISSRGEFQRVDGGLCQALRERNLIDKVGLDMLVAKSRDWKSMSDDQLLDFARRFFDEHGIRNGSQLRKKDAGLLETLRKRNLLDKVGFKEGYRVANDWNSMGEEELVGYAKGVIKEKGIRGRNHLRETDVALYTALLRRNLLDNAFGDMEKAKEKEVAQALFDLSMEFGDAQ